MGCGSHHGLSLLNLRKSPGDRSVLYLQVQRFVEAWITGTDGVTYTPGGLAWGSEWGSLRFVGNAAMIASVYAKNVQGAFYALLNHVSCMFDCAAAQTLRL